MPRDSARQLSSLVKGGHADKDAAWAELKRIAVAIGNPGEKDAKIESTLNSAWNYAKERDVTAPGLVAPACTIEDPNA